ncbi:beta strand repeat-containing protein [Streptomyces sp. NBC_01190]|uniref:beta strand repeat-containing protein n=1 Tax=Streptomyces sp. NBC_01190 TaxID=2903767 RepID=UPI00386312BE|nr:IPT/TIG domain-containing protein [Streptomyces sp. NBC_01190]
METPENPPSNATRPLAALVAPLITVSQPFSGLAGTTVTLTGSGFTGVTSVTFAGVPATSFTVISSTKITAVAPAGSGTVPIVVTTTGGVSNGIGFTYSIPTPVITTLSPSQGPPAGGNLVTLTGSGFTGATAVRFGATPVAFTVVSPTQITATAPAGTGTVNVTVTAPGGTSAGVPYTYVTAPVITTVNPAQGPVGGGNTVTLTGSGFTGATAVTFGATPATSFTVVSPTQITATAPAGTGTVNVTVTAPGGTSNSVPYTYVTAPVITTVNPAQGPVGGGNTVTLTGNGFTGATAVTFGATPATSFTVVSPTQITATAPAGTGTVNVTVTAPGGTSNSVPYTYVTAPVITTVNPAQGPVGGGNTVTLTGNGFTGATAVTFGATPATSFTVLSPTQITATAPAGVAGGVPVTVTTPGGTTPGTVFYFYVAQPTLTSATPTSGPTAGGNTVTLTGTNLLTVTAVNFGVTPATFTIVSNTQINAVAPAGSAGTSPITVVTVGGTSNAIPYTYVAGPVLTSLIPNQGAAAGGTIVTLTGTNLTGATAVLFGGVPAPFTAVSDTQLVATAPAGAAGPVTVTVVTPGGTTGGLTFTRLAGPDI